MRWRTTAETNSLTTTTAKIDIRIAETSRKAKRLIEAYSRMPMPPAPTKPSTVDSADVDVPAIDEGTVDDRQHLGQDPFKPGCSFSDRGYVERSVQMVRLDDFVARKNFGAVDLIKIDTEETEVDVLEGAKSLLSSCKPDLIIEVILSSNQSPALQSLLQGFGYRFYEITETDLVRLDDLSEIDERLKAKTKHRPYGEIYCTAHRADGVARVSATLRAIWVEPSARMSRHCE